jgi:molybdopterin/thiamine biosynthesis adenylyltransferase
LALAIAVLLAAAGICNQLWYRSVSREMTAALNRVFELVEQEDYEAADLAMTDLLDLREKLKTMLDITSNHNERDLLNEALVRTRVFLKERDMEQFAVESAYLAQLIVHIYDREKVSIVNIL